MAARHRSRCPINLAVEVFGDRWTLLVLRDIMFAGKRHYRELLASDERISTKILADRLRMLVDSGLLTKADDPSHRQKAVYSLTEPAIALVPVFAQIGAWGRQYLPASDELSWYADALDRGGPALCEAFMDDLREIHLGPTARHQPPGTGPSLADALR
ncbi:MAG: transcriptional regulator [Streptosporangiales bacterium]|nr:transcriptional regulator [Streptosporangiales bacterium]